jgi:hypothetical protein
MGNAARAAADGYTICSCHRATWSIRRSTPRCRTTPTRTSSR